MRPAIPHLRLALAGLIVAFWPLLGLPLQGRAEEVKVPAFWIKSFETRLWSGYKDNVLLGYRQTTDSPFVAAGLDITLFRFPTNGWEFLFLTSAEYTRYLSAQDADQEAIGIVQAQAKRTFLDTWKGGLSLEYFYFNQVFDNSTFEQILGALQVEGHSFGLRPSLGKELGHNYRLDLELPVARQEFVEFIDDYWEVGPKLILTKEYGHRSDVSLAYEFLDRLHDTRPARDASGQIEPGRGLEFYQHEFSAIWRHYWDEQRRWRTLTRAGVQRNIDNGGGYYDYTRPQFSEQIRFRAKTWEVQAEGKISYYHYDLQPIAEPGSASRERTTFRLTLRGEKKLVKELKAFAQYEHERALSNLALDRYTVNTIFAGLGWEF